MHEISLMDSIKQGMRSIHVVYNILHVHAY